LGKQTIQNKAQISFITDLNQSEFLCDFHHFPLYNFQLRNQHSFDLLLPPTRAAVHRRLAADQAQPQNRADVPFDSAAGPRFAAQKHRAADQHREQKRRGAELPRLQQTPQTQPERRSKLGQDHQLHPKRQPQTLQTHEQLPQHPLRSLPDHHVQLPPLQIHGHLLPFRLPRHGRLHVRQPPLPKTVLQVPQAPHQKMRRTHEGHLRNLQQPQSHQTLRLGRCISQQNLRIQKRRTRRPQQTIPNHTNLTNSALARSHRHERRRHRRIPVLLRQLQNRRHLHLPRHLHQHTKPHEKPSRHHRQHQRNPRISSQNRKVPQRTRNQQKRHSSKRPRNHETKYRH